MRDPDDIDLDLYAEAREERRRMNRRCRCGSGLPGFCPGPDACPYNHNDDEEETDDV